MRLVSTGLVDMGLVKMDARTSRPDFDTFLPLR